MYDAKLLRESFELALSREPELISHFFGDFFRMYPEVEPIFAWAAREEQSAQLHEALAEVVARLDDDVWLGATMRQHGHRQWASGVTAGTYPKFGAAMLRTLSDISGAEWSPVVEGQWTSAFTKIATLMLEGAAVEAPKTRRRGVSLTE